MHICQDEIMAALMVVPACTYLVTRARAWVQRARATRVAPCCSKKGGPLR